MWHAAFQKSNKECENSHYSIDQDAECRIMIGMEVIMITDGRAPGVFKPTGRLRGDDQ